MSLKITRSIDNAVITDKLGDLMLGNAFKPGSRGTGRSSWTPEMRRTMAARERVIEKHEARRKERGERSRF